MLKKVKRFFKWTGITIALLLLVLSAVVASRQHQTFEAPYPNIKASTDPAIIARGKDLVYGISQCVDCHAPGNVDSLVRLGIEPELKGGRFMDLPFGKLYVKNITPDPETGIGRLTDAEIARTIRYGVNSKGAANLMPERNLTDEDLTAVVSFLRSQKPVHNKVPPTSLNVMGAVVKAFLIKPPVRTEPIPATIKRDTSAAYGKYLATAVSECSGCHTGGMMPGAEPGAFFAGGDPMVDPGLPPLTPPNLTPHPEGRIYKWSQEDFIKRFRMGKIIKHSHMPWESFKKVSDNDLKAIYNFLKSLPPQKTHVAKKEG